MKTIDFQKKTVVLVGQLQLNNLLKMVTDLPIDAINPLEVTIKLKGKTRSLDQNAMYWVLVSQIAEHGWVNGKQFSKEVWHEYLRVKLLPVFVVDKNNDTVPKFAERPDGFPVAISTTMLSKKSFADYITAVEAFGTTELLIEFSANPNC
jgi:NinB protein